MLIDEALNEMIFKKYNVNKLIKFTRIAIVIFIN